MPLDPFADAQQNAGEPLRLPPWEQRDRFGLLNSLYLTSREVLLSPGRFFHRMPTRLGLVQPLLFGIAVTVVASFGDFLWWGLAGSSVHQLLHMRDLGGFLQAPVAFGVLWVFSPLVALVQIVVRAMIFHVCLMVVGGARQSFEATFRVVAYGRAAGVLALLPFCGSAIGFVWEIAVTVIGLARLHEVEEWRPALAVVLPLALLLMSCGGLLALIVGASVFH